MRLRVERMLGNRVGRGLAPAVVGEQCIATVTRQQEDECFHHSSTVNGKVFQL